MTLTRFWFKFHLNWSDPHPMGTIAGCGVTAYDYQDALGLLKNLVFKEDLPKIKECIENVDISTLDEKHVLPNMGNIFRRGIWFPLGYE